MVCPNCNAQNPDLASFCAKCGCSLNVASFDAEKQRDITPQTFSGQKPDVSSGKKEKKKKPKKKLITAICIIVIAALIAGCAGWFGFSYINDKDNEGSIYTVTFDINADEAEVSSIPDAQSVEYGSSASVPAYPVRYGYFFGGWYTDEECTKEYNFSKAVKKDLTLYAAWLDPDSEEAQITDEECEDYFDCLDDLGDVYESYCEDGSYISEENIETVILAAKEVLDEYKDDGIVTYYSAEDNAIYVEFSSLLTYVFMVSEEGTSSDPTDLDSYLIYAFYDTDWAWENASGIASNEDLITETLESFSNATSVYSDDISWRNGFSAAAGCDIVIWDGHGGYVSDLGCILATAETVSTATALIDELDLYIGDDYQTLNRALGTKVVTIVGVGTENVYALTPTYFEIFFPELDDAIVYLSACKSGYDSSLADVFISKGAQVVIANAGTDAIKTWYTEYMIYAVFSRMNTADDDGSYYTVQEALDIIFENGYSQSYVKNDDGTITYQDAYPQLFYESGNSDAVNYTLWAGIEGTITSTADIDMGEISISLMNNTTNESITSVAPDEDGRFVINELDGGEENSYSLYVLYDGVEIYSSENIIIQSHRYTDLGDVVIDGIEVDIYVTDEDGEDISEALVSLTDEDGNVYSASLGTDDSLNYVYKTSVMPGEYTIEISCDGYKSITDSVSVEDDALVLSFELEKEDMDIPEDAAEYNGHHYYIYDIGNDIEAAIEYCESLGGHMATITSSGENDFLYDYMLSNDLESVYFGFSDAAEEGTWIWLNGESVSYTNWHSGEPNSENDDEDYAMFYWKYDDGTWNDGDFGTGGTNGGGCAFICEWDG